MRSRDALGYRTLFFLSGATGLVYQLLWVRLLYQAFGSTIQSVTTVVAAYMGGLGLGAWLLGRFGDRHRRPAALYGWLEVAIAAFGLLSPLILALAHRLYVAVASALGLSGAPSVALRFGLAALVLLVPTTLMGGTLPVLTRAFTGDTPERLRPELGRLYGLNTLGAMVGTAVAGFVLIEHVGIRWGLLGTAAVNLALGAAAIALANPRPVGRGQAESQSLPDPGREPGEHRTPVELRRAALVLLAVTAFASLLAEIAWTRVLVMIVGGSTYAFTLILLVFLLGIGIGSPLGGRLGGAPRETAAGAAFAQGVTAAGAALLFVFFHALPVYIVSVFQVQYLSATTRLLLMGLAVGFVVLIPTIGMGMTFPLLTDLAARREWKKAGAGEEVGRAYALNTIGSIVGTVLTGFVLVVTLGTDLTLRLGLVVSAGAALALAVLAARGVAEGGPEHVRLRARVLGAGALAAVGLSVAFVAPRWDTRLFDLGPTIYARNPMNAAGLAAFLSHRGVRQAAFREGRNATVSVWESETGRALKVNGKADASDRGDMDTQIMIGLAPVAARPGARSALLIGYGSGVTARVLSEAPGMEQVRVVEIEPAVLAMSPYFEHVNGGVLGRPNVRVVVDDARSALQLTRERHDVIVSEPSNPWTAGVATLYTPEFFRIVRSRLADSGVFGQWIQIYQLPLPVIAGVVRNLRAVFPHMEIWFGAPQDLIILASGRPIAFDRDWLARLVGPKGALGELGREWVGIDAPEDFFSRHLLGPDGVARLVEAATLAHSDDRPRLEFVAARRFLDAEGAQSVFDALLALREPATQVAADGTGRRPEEEERDDRPVLLVAQAFVARRSDTRGLLFVEAARRERPDEGRWAVHLATLRLALGDTTRAEGELASAAGLRGGGDALLLRGQIAARRRQDTQARALLTAALGAGADTARVGAALAAVATSGSRWSEAAGWVRRALGATRNTLRHPFPGDFLAETLDRFALSGPPATADSLLAETLTRRPAWARVHELRAAVALRTRRCDAAVESLLTLLDFGIERADGPQLVAECRRGA